MRRKAGRPRQIADELILEFLERHPKTSSQALADYFAVHVQTMRKYLRALIKQGKIKKTAVWYERFRYHWGYSVSKETKT